jgi:hypothetical protein
MDKYPAKKKRKFLIQRIYVILKHAIAPTYYAHAFCVFVRALLVGVQEIYRTDE